MGIVDERYAIAQHHGITEERTRIARDLHDGPMQTFTHIAHKLEFVQRLLEKQAVDHAQRELHHIRAILEAGLHTFRDDISTLMTAQKSTLDIGDALRDLLTEYRTSEPNVKLTSTIDTLNQLPPMIAHPLFRFVQEALNNIRNHAHATEVVLRVHLNTTCLIAEVCDNGIGLPCEQGLTRNISTRQHMGLRILHERVQEVGGVVEIQSTHGMGTRMKAIFPISLA
jgi:two-component system sensor histidine kinase DegS